MAYGDEAFLELLEKECTKLQANTAVISSLTFKIYTPLILSVLFDSVELIEEIRKKYRDINYRTTAGYSALTYAIQRNCEQSFFHLLMLRAEFTLTEKKEIVKNLRFFNIFYSPCGFLKIVNSGNLLAFNEILIYINGIQNLVEKNKFLCVKNTNGQHALLIAAANGYAEMVEQLLELDFELLILDDDENSIIYYLKKQKLLNLILKVTDKMRQLYPRDVNILRQLLDEFELSTKEERAIIGRALTVEQSSPQEGRLAKPLSLEVHATPHSFFQERERQILRHIATQLYFALKEYIVDKNNVVEVQILHLAFQKKSFIFIAANKSTITQHLKVLLNSAIALKHVLLKQYQTSDEEGNLRSARYAAKLAYRIYGENVSFPNTTKEDFKNTISLARTLRTGDIIIHRVEPKFSDETANLLEILQGKSDKIILLDIVSGKNNERHAEEYLTDIVEEARNFASITDKTVYSCIAGKKRPCMGCLGRMKNVVNKYNQHPGRFWLASIKSQSPQAAKETVKILLNKPSYVTLTRYGKIETSYDSDSATSADSSDDEFFSCNSESES